MHEFKHPKYYTELRKLRNKLDQAISDECATAPRERSPGPGLKQQAIEETVPHCDIEEATSDKQQATSTHPDLLPAHGPEYYAPRRRRKR